jgi:hypothetical protein
MAVNGGVCQANKQRNPTPLPYRLIDFAADE